MQRTLLEKCGKEKYKKKDTNYSKIAKLKFLF